MNLRFKTVKVEGDYELQRAVVTDNRNFWYNWRNPETKKELKQFLTVRREKLKNENHWCVYRLFSRLKDIPYGKFSSSYVLHSTSGLLPYQPPVVSHHCSAILEYGATADGSDTGIGKTYTALATCRELAMRPAVVCKKAGISSWKRGCLHFGIKPLFIVNWEQAKNGKFKFTQRKRDRWDGVYTYKWFLPEDILLIFDEVHVASQPGTQNHNLYIASRGHASISISATFADRVERLRGLFYVLGIVPYKQFAEWMNEIGNRFVNANGVEESIDNQTDMKIANRYLYPDRAVRISYNHPEVRKVFPEAVYRTEIVNLSIENEKKQNVLYKQALQKVEHYRSLGNNAEAMVAELRYRQSAELLKASVLYDLIKDYMLEGKSVVVFVNYRETLKYLAKLCKTNSLIFGGQERYHVSREEVIDAFQQNKTRLILSMVDAGGASISLHDLDGNYPRISLVCPTYNPVMLKQVLGRTYRAGSKSTPVVKLVYAGRTIEEKVADSVNAKLSNISALNDGDLMEPDFFRLQDVK